MKGKCPVENELISERPGITESSKVQTIKVTRVISYNPNTMQRASQLDARRAREELTQTLIISFMGLDFVEKNLCGLLFSPSTMCDV